MELLSSRDIFLTRSTDTPVLYTAFGWIAGSFRPGKRKHDWGELVTTDGQTLKAKLDWRLRSQLKQKQKEPSAEPECLDTVYRWKVYPRSSLLRLDLIKRQPLHSNTAQSKGGLTNQPGQLDEFRLVGEIVGVSEGKVRVCIHRQEPPPLGEEKSLFYQPHTLTVKGNLPSDAILQICSLKAQREGAKLVIVASHPYQANPEDITALQGNTSWLRVKQYY